VGPPREINLDQVLDNPAHWSCSTIPQNSVATSSSISDLIGSIPPLTAEDARAEKVMKQTLQHLNSQIAKLLE